MEEYEFEDESLEDSELENEETETTTEVSDESSNIDIYDYAIVGVPSIILILLTIKFCFKKFSFKFSKKDGIEISSEK